MKMLLISLTVALSLLVSPDPASAQTADEVIEKSLAALGGRAAHGKLKSRSVTGTIVLATPAGDITGSIEVLNAVPNKSRTLIKADLTALGAGPIVFDQRFDGSSGYVMDTLQGNREITGNQLDNLRNNSFPHLFLSYKELGTAVQLSGKEKVGDRDAYVVTFDPASGSLMRQYLDAETYLPIMMVMKVEVPQIGGEIEQTTEFLDYKEIDGIKLPFRVRSSSTIQNFTITATKVEHNVKVDETLFSKPATPIVATVDPRSLHPLAWELPRSNLQRALHDNEIRIHQTAADHHRSLSVRHHVQTAAHIGRQMEGAGAGGEHGA